MGLSELRWGAAEGRLAMGQLERHAGQRVQIGPRSELPPLSGELLGGHVARGPGGRWSLCSACSAGDPEVGELEPGPDIGRTAAQHIGRLQITVHEAACMGVGQRVEQHDQDRAKVGEGAGWIRAQGAAAGQLHGHPRRAVGQHAVLVDCDQGSVVEAGHGDHLATERVALRRLSSETGGQHLDRDGRASETGAPDLAHGAGSEPRFDLERSDPARYRQLSPGHVP